MPKTPTVRVYTKQPKRSCYVRLQPGTSVEEFISSKGGVLLRTYTLPDKGSRTFCDYTCENGHERVGIARSSIPSAWCGQCKRVTMDDAVAIAAKKEGTLLSLEFKGAHEQHDWRCKSGHTFTATYTNVRAGTWCKYCLKHSIIDMQELAKSKGGLFMSSTYTNLAEKYSWQCKYGHKWIASANGIMQGTWCGSCSLGRNENLCRSIVEYLYEVPFVKKRPGWLTSHNGNPMELDMFNEDLKIAFEYNGVQHVKRVTVWQTEEEFQDLQARDALKIVKCKEHDIHLVVIPHTVKYNELYTFIKAHAPNLPKDKPDTIDYADLHLEGSRSEMMLKEIQKYVSDTHGGECLSTSYVNYKDTKLKFRCKEGHMFEQVWRSVKHIGSWCSTCSKQQRRDNRVKSHIEPFLKLNDLKLLTEYNRCDKPLDIGCVKCGTVRFSHVTWAATAKRTILPCSCAK